MRARVISLTFPGAAIEAEAMKKYNTYINYKNHVVLQDLAGFPLCDEQQFRFLFVSAILLLMVAASGKARQVRVVGEKTPDKLWTHLPVLMGLFPAAKLDPRIARPARRYDVRMVS